MTLLISLFTYELCTEHRGRSVKIVVLFGRSLVHIRGRKSVVHTKMFRYFPQLFHEYVGTVS